MQKATYAVKVCVAFALCVVSAFAAAQPAQRLDPETCLPIPQEQAVWLTAPWQPFQKYVKSCAIGRNKKTVLYLLAVWVDDYYAKLPPSEPAAKFPKPILMAADGTQLGQLPMDFPSDPPRTLVVTLADWSGGFPRQIRLWVEDPTVLGNHRLPSLEWDETAKQFKTSMVKEKLKDARPGQ